MYQVFYRLRASPFAPTADPRHLFLSQGHKEALASVTYELQRGGGVVVMLGDVGTGKTTLIRHIRRGFGTNTKPAFVLKPPGSFDELLQVVFQQLELPWQGWSPGEAIDTLSHHLRGERAARRDFVIVVDEAQHLSSVLLEEIQLLSNLELGGRRLLQMILVGQPELGAKLALPGLRPLRQRIGLVAKLRPLSHRETVGYITHRLKVAGHKGRSLFTRPALRKIYQASGGIPRLVNAICDGCLARGYEARAPRINSRIVKAVVEDLWASGKDPVTSPVGGRPPCVDDRRMRIRWALGWITAVLLVPVIAGTLLPLARDGVVLPPLPGLRPETGSTERPAPAETVREDAGPAEEGAPSVPAPHPTETPVSQVPAPRPSAASELSGHPPTSRETPEVPEVIVRPGDTIASLVMGVYGRVDYTLLDFVNMANPEIRNFNSIQVGQRLRFPRFEPSAMVQKGANALYLVHLLTVWDTSTREFAQLRGAVLKSGRTMYVTPVRLTDASGLRSPFPQYPEVYRVMVGDFPDREQAEGFYRTFQGRE